MGARGPVPKRSTERRRRNKSSAVETVESIVSTVEAPAANSRWHPIAKDWFESLKTSGQSQFYEPSDWQAARYVAEVMSRNLRQTKFSSILFASVLSAMSDLLTTEAARRRVRMEIERPNPNEGAPPAGVTAISDYRKRLAGKSG
jgi:hypothetical protein